MRLATFILLTGGLALFVGLIVDQGIGEVYQATAAAGWGVLAAAAFHLVPVMCDTMAWRNTMADRHRLPFAFAGLWERWFGPRERRREHPIE